METHHAPQSTSTTTLPSTALTDAMAQLAKTVHCPVCMDYMISPVTLPCSHTYCQECIEEVMRSSPRNYCPLCHAIFTKKNISGVSKTLEPVISSIRNFVACFEGKPDSDSVSTGDEALHVDKKFRMQRPDFKAGDLVHVAPRLWPGINKPGGTAWIQAVREEAEKEASTAEDVSLSHVHPNILNGGHTQMGVYYDCKYVLGGGIDIQVPAAYIRVANDLNEERESRSRRSKPPKLEQKRVSPKHTGRRSSAGNKSKAALEDVQEDTVASPTTRIPTPVASEGCHNKNMNRPLVFLCSTLQTEELLEVQQFCERFPPAAVHETYSSAVTHVIVHVDRKGGKGKGKSPMLILKNRTMKYLQGVLGHKWIVSCDWLGDCLHNNCLLDEMPYEVSRDSKADAASFGPKWSREHLLGPSRPAALCDAGDVLRDGLFDVGCQYIFAGPFCHPGPTIDNLSFLLKMGGGNLLSNVAAVVDLINVSLDGGLRVQRKHAPCLEELIVVVVTSAESANEFCQQVFISISDIRKECAYDFGDFIDHLNGFVAVILADWIFDCISNYQLSDPLRPSRFRVDLDRSEYWEAVGASSEIKSSSSSSSSLSSSSST